MNSKRLLRGALLRFNPKISESSISFSMYSSMRAAFISSCSATQMQLSRINSFSSRRIVYWFYRIGLSEPAKWFERVSLIRRSRPSSEEKWGRRSWRYPWNVSLGCLSVAPNLMNSLRISWSLIRSLLRNYLTSWNSQGDTTRSRYPLFVRSRASNTPSGENSFEENPQSFYFIFSIWVTMGVLWQQRWAGAWVSMRFFDYVTYFEAANEAAPHSSWKINNYQRYKQNTKVPWSPALLLFF